MTADQPAFSAADTESLHRYLTALDLGLIDDALACFSEEIVYVHPGAGPDWKRVEIRGLSALRQFFVDRGRKPWRHGIDVCLSGQGHCLVHGSVISGMDEVVGNFMACAAIDADGKIYSYRAYASLGVPVTMYR